MGGTVADRALVADRRRGLQRALGLIWLLDGALQCQPSMFGRGFPQMLADAAAGNPAVVAGPVAWAAAVVGHHLAVLNAAFATTQVALGLGIAWRPAVRAALGASVAWALAVWWLGEGLGGVLTGSASPVSGAPGAVVLYALLAVLLWSSDRDLTAGFVAGFAVGRRIAQAAWLVLWASLAYFALTPESRAPQATSGMVAAMTAGQPGWLAWIDHPVVRVVGGQGLLASGVLAIALLVVAAGPFLPVAAARASVVLAVVLAVALWLAEGLGGIFTGSATDRSTAIEPGQRAEQRCDRTAVARGGLFQLAFTG